MKKHQIAEASASLIQAEVRFVPEGEQECSDCSEEASYRERVAGKDLRNILGMRCQLRQQLRRSAGVTRRVDARANKQCRQGETASEYGGLHIQLPPSFLQCEWLERRCLGNGFGQPE